MKHAFLRCAVAGGAAVLGASSYAQMIGNMPQTNDTNLSATLNNLRHKALGFMMGNDPYRLKWVDVRIGNYDLPGEVNLEIWDSNTANQPGAPVHTLFAPGPGGTPIQTYTFSANGPFTFQANTLYWLRMSGPLGGNADWRGSSPVITPTGPGATHFGSLFTTNVGTSWTNSTTLNSYSMFCNIVPEPGTVAAIGVGLALLVFRRKR